MTVSSRLRLLAKRRLSIACWRFRGSFAGENFGLRAETFGKFSCDGRGVCGTPSTRRSAMPSGWWDTVVFDERSERPLLPFLLAAITMWATAFVLAFLSGLPLTFPVPT